MKYLMIGAMLLVAACGSPKVSFSDETRVILSLEKAFRTTKSDIDIATAECEKHGRDVRFTRYTTSSGFIYGIGRGPYSEWTCVEKGE